MIRFWITKLTKISRERDKGQKIFDSILQCKRGLTKISLIQTDLLISYTISAFRYEICKQIQNVKYLYKSLNLTLLQARSALNPSKCPHSFFSMSATTCYITNICLSDPHIPTHIWSICPVTPAAWNHHVFIFFPTTSLGKWSCKFM